MKPKKKLGIIGGMGSRASSIFLQRIIEYSPAETDQEFIEIILHNNASIPDRTRAIIYNEPSPVNEILRSIKLFNENNVDVIALACITSYHFYGQIAPFSNAEILNPVKLLLNEIEENHQSVKKIGLLATTGTIHSRLFHNELESCELEVVSLSPYEQEEYFMKAVYMKNGLKSSSISEEAIQLLLKASDKLINKGAEIIVGACSEVPIVLTQSKLTIPFIDSIDLLARESVNQCYNLKISKSLVDE